MRGFSIPLSDNHAVRLARYDDYLVLQNYGIINLQDHEYNDSYWYENLPIYLKRADGILSLCQTKLLT